MAHSTTHDAQRAARVLFRARAHSRTRGRTIFFVATLLLALFGLTASGQRVSAEAVYILPPASETAVLMYKSVHYSGETISKPTCDPWMTAKIFVAPVRMLGGASTTIVPIAGVSTFAIDNGDGKWTVRGQIKTADNDNMEDKNAVAMIVETYCCVNELCN